MPPARSSPPAQTLEFPRIGLTLEVACDRDRVVRVGFVRPESFRAFRETILAAVERSAPAGGSTAETRHALNNLLNRVTLGFHLFQKQLDLGAHDEAERAFRRVCTDLQSLESEWGLGSEPTGGAGGPTRPGAPAGGPS